MIWLVLLVLVIAIFGLGSVLEAALWTMLVAAVVVVAGVVLAGRALSR